MSEVPHPNHGAMFNLELSSDDRKWLSKEHSSLKVEENLGSIVVLGSLTFEMVYEPDDDKFFVFPRDYKGKGVLIKDQYDIRILIPKTSAPDLPKVYAIGSRITDVAKQKSLPTYDLHFNFDGSACLYVVGKEKEYFPNDFDFKIFMNQLVIPFFYAQSYFQKFGEWPWGEYAHGISGMFEWYNEQENPTESNVKQMLERLKIADDWKLISGKFKGKNWVKGHSDCLCGSGKKMRNCHNIALRGMWKFGNDVKKHNLDQNI